MKSWFVQFLAPVITRHAAQYLSGLLLGFAAFKGHDSDVESLALSIVSGIVSLGLMAWAGKKATPAEIVKDALQVPGVIRDQTKIVSNDPKLVAKTPSEVVYGQDMSIQ